MSDLQKYIEERKKKILNLHIIMMRDAKTSK